MKYKDKLSLDFFLPDYYIFIECQGRQHFEAVDKYGGKKGFEETKIRDRIKYESCLAHNIYPIYYSPNKKHTTFIGEELIRNENELIIKINGHIINE